MRNNEVIDLVHWFALNLIDSFWLIEMHPQKMGDFECWSWVYHLKTMHSFFYPALFAPLMETDS